MASSKKKVLVCGATGFIGRNMAYAMACRDDMQVYGTYFSSPPWDHPKVHMVQADLRCFDDVHRVLAGMDIVIQAAATTSGAKDIINHPYLHVTDNAIMNSLLFRAAHDLGVKTVIFFSCSVVYPSRSARLKESDQDPAEIPRPYFGVGWTKLYLERIAEFFARLGKTQFVVLRHSNVYGPYDKFDLERSHVLGATVAKVAAAREGRIVIWGDGSEQRDLLHVSDLVSFVNGALDAEREPFTLVNVGSGEGVSIKDLAHRVIRASGRDLRIENDLSRPTIKTRQILDCGKAREMFGWEPQTSLDEGISQTWQWYLAHMSERSTTS